MDGHSKIMQTFETTGGKNINKTKQKNSKKREKTAANLSELQLTGGHLMRESHNYKHLVLYVL